MRVWWWFGILALGLACESAGGGFADVGGQADLLGEDVVRGEDLPVVLDVPVADAGIDAGIDVGADVFVPPSCNAATSLTYETGLVEVFRRGPYLQSVMGNGAVVVWMQDEASGEGCVDYAIGEEAPQTLCASPDERGQYEVRLSGLPAGAAVTYTARSGEREAGPFTFHAAPSADEAVKLLTFADAHANRAAVEVVAQAGLAAGVHMAIGVGDLVSQPVEDQWDAFFGGLRALGHRVGFWPVQGNHEAKHESYFHNFVVPGAAQPPYPEESYYAARVGQVWFASLELEDWLFHAFFMGGETPQTRWLSEALESAEARSARWRLLFIHQAPWAMGWGHCDGYNGEPALRAYLVPFAAAHGVAAIFSGHMHGWERGEVEGVTLITTGGAGGGLDHECEQEGDWPEPWVGIYEYHYTIVEADCEAMTITAHDFDGELLDQVVVSPR